MLRPVLPLAALLTLGSAQTPTRSQRACDLAEQRTALFKRAVVTADDGYMTSSLSRLFADDGFMLGPGPITERGPAGVTRVLSRDTLNPTTKVRMTTIGGDVSADGQDGFSYGYLDGMRAKGDSVPGWYHAYWRRDKGGQWRVLAMVRRRRPVGETSRFKAPAPLASTQCRDGKAVDTAAVLKQVMAADLAFSDSAARSVANAFAMFASDDAAKSGKEAAFVYGKEAIRSLYEPPPPNGLKWWPEIGTVSRSGDFGFTVGGAGPRVAPPDAPPPNPATAGHYFTIWRRDANGQWRYVID